MSYSWEDMNELIIKLASNTMMEEGKVIVMNPKDYYRFMKGLKPRKAVNRLKRKYPASKVNTMRLYFKP